MTLEPCRECNAMVSTDSKKCKQCGVEYPTILPEKVTDLMYSYKNNEITKNEYDLYRINPTEIFARCAKNFCQEKYKVLKIPKSKLDKKICSGCGNKLETVSQKQAKQYFENKDLDFLKVKTDKFENLGKMTKKFKNKASTKNIEKMVESLMKSRKRKKKLRDMSKEELINEVAETKFHSLSNKQLIGGCIGILGYIIVKEIGDWGWHYGDIVGLFLLAFLPGALFIGGMLEER